MPLQTVFAFKIACFTLLVKIFEINQTYIPISLQNPTQLIFGLMKKMSARSFRRSRRFFHFKIACFSVFIWINNILYCFTEKSNKYYLGIKITIQYVQPFCQSFTNKKGAGSLTLKSSRAEKGVES